MPLGEQPCGETDLGLSPACEGFPLSLGSSLSRWGQQVSPLPGVPRMQEVELVMCQTAYSQRWQKRAFSRQRPLRNAWGCSGLYRIRELPSPSHHLRRASVTQPRFSVLHPRSCAWCPSAFTHAVPCARDGHPPSSRAIILETALLPSCC